MELKKEKGGENSHSFQATLENSMGKPKVFAVRVNADEEQCKEIFTIFNDLSGFPNYRGYCVMPEEGSVAVFDSFTKDKVRTAQEYFADTQMNDALLIAFLKETLNMLDSLHQRRRVHGNISPSNIQVVDVLGGSLSFFFTGNRTVQSCASPVQVGFQSQNMYYTAPEILSGDPYNEKADIWSYGVTLFELVTGKLPFKVHPAEPIKRPGDKKKRPVQTLADMTHHVTEFIMDEKEIRNAYLNSNISFGVAFALAKMTTAMLATSCASRPGTVLFKNAIRAVKYRIDVILFPSGQRATILPFRADALDKALTRDTLTHYLNEMFGIDKHNAIIVAFENEPESAMGSTIQSMRPGPDFLQEKLMEGTVSFAQTELDVCEFAVGSGNLPNAKKFFVFDASLLRLPEKTPFSIEALEAAYKPHTSDAFGSLDENQKQRLKTTPKMEFKTQVGNFIDAIKDYQTAIDGLAQVVAISIRQLRKKLKRSVEKKQASKTRLHAMSSVLDLIQQKLGVEVQSYSMAVGGQDGMQEESGLTKVAEHASDLNEAIKTWNDSSDVIIKSAEHALTTIKSYLDFLKNRTTTEETQAYLTPEENEAIIGEIEKLQTLARQSEPNFSEFKKIHDRGQIRKILKHFFQTSVTLLECVGLLSENLRGIRNFDDRNVSTNCDEIFDEACAAVFNHRLFTFADQCKQLQQAF